MPTETSPRFSFRPVACLVGMLSTDNLAQLLDVDADKIPAVRRDGLTAKQAEAVAAAFAIPPAALWPAWTTLQNIARTSLPSQTGSARLYSFDEVTRYLATTSVQTLATHLRVGKDAVRRMIARGLTHDQAEDVAIRIGTLPEQLWPEWLDHHIETSVEDERGGMMNTMPARVARSWDREQVVQAVRRCAADLAKPNISLRDYISWAKTQQYAPGHSTLYKLLGSWRAAVSAAGVTCAGDNTPPAGTADTADNERRSIHRILLATKPSPLTVAEVATMAGIPAFDAAKHVEALYAAGAVQAVQDTNGETRYCAVSGH
jgi:hypothetical protein